MSLLFNVDKGVSVMKEREKHRRERNKEETDLLFPNDRVKLR